tara:strand:- start:498 stop:851 length:354 start_codon:yes stop_codon:yes gene_type:complete
LGIFFQVDLANLNAVWVNSHNKESKMLTDIVKTKEECVCERAERVAAELYRLKPAYLIDAIRREHRTNQQLIAVFILELLQHWSNEYEAGNYDLRNEATCEMAHDVMDDRTPHLPYI